MKLRIVLFIFLLLSVISNAQQEAQYTQYMYNTANINPAYAGSRGMLSILAMHRTQWLGLDGAPVTNTITMHTPISDRVGLGLSVVNDKLGPSDENVFSADFSYNIPTSENYKLAFGIKGTLDLFNVDPTKLNPQLTPTVPLTFTNTAVPNVGAGVFWYSNKSYLGLSVPYMLDTKKYYDNTSIAIVSERMHLHVMAGYVFDIGENTKFKPSILTKVVKGAPLQVDLSANFLLFDKLTLGAAYRWSAAMSVMAGFQISDSWLIGYAYDKDTTRLGNFNSGSHEVFLRYELFKKYDKVVAPRFF
jgi:type IX secretion system PorP/SprF family membrane protein